MRTQKSELRMVSMRNKIKQENTLRFSNKSAIKLLCMHGRGQSSQPRVDKIS